MKNKLFRLTLISVISFILLSMVPAINAKYIEIDFEFYYNTAPSWGYTLKCVDAYTGVIVLIKTNVQPGQEYSAWIPKDEHDKILCWIEAAAGPTIHKWRIYPKRYYQGGGFSATMTLPDAERVGKCGDGKVTGIEKCDTANNEGCVASSAKPKCCRCEYCGCGSDKDCPRITGAQCGYGKCSEEERPVFTPTCYDCGICIYPYKCVSDPTCKKEEKVEVPKKPENYEVHVDSYDGAASCELKEGDTETYIINDKSYSVEVISISETAAGGEGSVKFRINGEITDELKDGETDILEDGTLIGIKDILTTGKDIQKSLVQFYIVDGDVLKARTFEFLYGEEFEEFTGEENLETIKDLYNANLQRIPFVASLFRNERINLYIGGDMNFSFITEDGRIETIAKGQLGDPTVNIYTDVETVEELLEGEMTFTEALKEGKIGYEGVGFFNSIKYGLADFLFKIYLSFAGEATQVNASDGQG